tara:strand:- start:1975 stop:2901 length:927 start_codon:yes stop_codon:yes gene_type:complete
MKSLTNLDVFPIPVQRFLMDDTYDGGQMTDISATRLIDSPRISRLRSEYSHEVVEDAKRRIAAALGTAFHNLMEEYSPDEWVVEERFYATVNEKIISGQVDALAPVEPKEAKKIFGKDVENPVVIQDWKVITGFKAKMGMEDYEKQGNIYAYLVRKNGYTPVSFVIWALIKDWKEADATRDPNYPQLPIMKYEYKLWEEEKIENYIKERVDLHFSDAMPECSEDEMWVSKVKWEAKKKGHTRPTKLFDEEREAFSWIADQDHRATKGTTHEDWEITQRPSSRRRCEGNWCNVADFCDQYKKWKEQNDS